MTREAISALRQRMIEDMSVRKFGDKTKIDYTRHVETFARFLGRSPDTATGEDLRRYQVHQTESGAAIDGEQRRGGAALLSHHHPRPPRTRLPTRAGALSAQTAAGAEP